MSKIIALLSLSVLPITGSIETGNIILAQEAKSAFNGMISAEIFAVKI